MILWLFPLISGEAFCSVLRRVRPLDTYYIREHGFHVASFSDKNVLIADCDPAKLYKVVEPRIIKSFILQIGF